MLIQRLKVVNEVLLPGYMSSLNASTDSMAVYESLDKVDESTAALWLPVALAVSLLGTLVVLTLSNSPPPSMPGFEIPFAATIAKSTQSIAILGNFAVCILFVKAVFKSAFVEFKFDKLLVRIFNFEAKYLFMYLYLMITLYYL